MRPVWLRDVIDRPCTITFGRQIPYRPLPPAIDQTYILSCAVHHGPTADLYHRDRRRREPWHHCGVIGSISHAARRGSSPDTSIRASRASDRAPSSISLPSQSRRAGSDRSVSQQNRGNKNNKKLPVDCPCYVSKVQGVRRGSQVRRRLSRQRSQSPLKRRSRQ